MAAGGGGRRRREAGWNKKNKNPYMAMWGKRKTTVEVSAPNSRPLSLMIIGNKHNPNLGLNKSPQNHDKY